jgi:hypothetical protein
MITGEDIIIIQSKNFTFQNIEINYLSRSFVWLCRMVSYIQGRS